MTGDLHVRMFSRKDLNKVLEIRRVSMVREFEIFGLREESFRKQLKLRAFLNPLRKLFGKVLRKIYVAEVKGRIVGIAFLSKNEGSWVISAVMVDPKHRRKGYGKALVSKACNDAGFNGASKIVVYVSEDNVPAKSLYESMGFENFERYLYYYKDVCKWTGRPLPLDVKLMKVRILPHRRLLNSIFGYAATERFVVVQDDKLIGVLALSLLSKKYASCASIHIRRENRGRGIEHILLAQAIDITCQLGSPRLIIGVDENNVALKSACEKLGFKKSLVVDGMIKRLSMSTGISTNGVVS